jgi:tellurite methyltransferase
MSVYKYQKEYESSVCFWGTEPAKYVKLFAEKINSDLKNYYVLDVGAGEGKNAVYLASFGAKVLAVDLSKIALMRFNQQPNFEKVKDRIIRIAADVRQINFNKSTFDLIVAYGLFHCLDNLNDIKKLIRKLKFALKLGGYLIASSFTSEIPIPKIQSYLDEKALVEKDTFKKIFSDCNIIFLENDVITETHPTSQIEHQHSLTRIIVQK